MPDPYQDHPNVAPAADANLVWSSRAGSTMWLPQVLSLQGNRVWALGDSQMIRQGQTLPLTLALDEGQPLAWAGNISNQRIWPEGIAASGGYTTNDIINTKQSSGLTWLQTVIQARPAACVTLIGTNDIGAGTPNATIIANYKTIFSALAAAGIVPVVCSLLPRAAFLSGIHTLNVWLRRYALENSYPYVDFYSLIVDPTTGGLAAAYDFGDGLHQNAAGGKLMGQAVNDALAFLLPLWQPPLPAANTDATGINTNPLFLTDTNADGVPDNWTISGAGAVSTLTVDGAVLGKSWNITRGGTDLLLFSNLQAAPAGHVMEIAGRIKATLKATSAGLAVRATGGVSSVEEAAPIGRAAALWHEDLPWTTFYSRYIVKANNPSARMQLDLKAGNGTISLAQVIQRDLTALGLA